jgi:hypothetical protein
MFATLTIGIVFCTRWPGEFNSICGQQAPRPDTSNGHRVRCHIPVDELLCRCYRAVKRRTR